MTNEDKAFTRVTTTEPRTVADLRAHQCAGSDVHAVEGCQQDARSSQGGIEAPTATSEGAGRVLALLPEDDHTSGDDLR